MNDVGTALAFSIVVLAIVFCILRVLPLIGCGRRHSKLRGART